MAVSSKDVVGRYNQTMDASYRTKQILIMVFALILALVVAYVRVKNELQIQRAREARRLAE
jgi:hypothetical protein